MVSDASESDKGLDVPATLDNLTVSEHLLFQGRLCIVTGFSDDHKQMTVFTYNDGKTHTVNLTDELETNQFSDLQ